MAIARLLIANRGEIAVRVARTAREMGIETVAVFAEADRGAMHTRAADRAVSLGPGRPLETYLSIEKLIAAARESDADAVHPGYGFLSENTEFARAVAGAGLTWVGPPPSAIEAMGDKLRARSAMEKAGVPVVPGSRAVPAGEGDAALLDEARRLGFPVLIKASAGGGGKGMSRVERIEDLPAALEEGRRLSQAAFGDGTVYLERLLEGCRHVEIQVFGDSKGNLVSLYERECSVQRRHQKIVEETPSPGLGADDALRRAMGEAAVAGAKAVGYVGAGTVEFLLDGPRFYFLEMNTRLQVEHPITEATLGIDLVRAQLEVASGAPLPASWRDGSLRPRGHAIELRLYAEDPVEFLPRSGRILRWREPLGPGVRVDAGVEEASVVGVDYDPLLAKLVLSAETREAAIERAVRALQDWIVLGVETNARLLAAVLASERFRSGRYDTNLVPHLPPLETSEPPDAAWIAAALAPSAGASSSTPQAPGGRAADPWDVPSSWRPGA